MPLNAYYPLIRLAASKYKVNPNLIKAVIMQESGGDPEAISPCGAIGLMQLMPGTARDMGIKHPRNPKENIMGGTRYLSLMLKMFNGNIALGLAAYNAGPGSVNKYGGIPPYRETQDYVFKIMSLFENFRKGVKNNGTDFFI